MNIDNLRQLLDEATPGPWIRDGADVIYGPGGEGQYVGCADTPSDAALIVALRNAAPDLLAAVEALEWMLSEDDDSDMCPNCVTPWKCNGPHIMPQEHARAVLRRLRGEEGAEGRREAVATPEQLMEASAFFGVVITYQQARSILARLYDLHRHGRSSDPERAPDENAELLRRLDAWTERDNPGPLIRWAAAHLRGEAALQAADEGADR